VTRIILQIAAIVLVRSAFFGLSAALVVLKREGQSAAAEMGQIEPLVITVKFIDYIQILLV